MKDERSSLPKLSAGRNVSIPGEGGEDVHRRLALTSKPQAPILKGLPQNRDIMDRDSMYSRLHNGISAAASASCWLTYFAGPRRYLAVLPSNVRPNLFAGD